MDTQIIYRKKEDRRRLIEKVKIRRTSFFPTLSSIMIGKTKIIEIEEEDSIAYTKFNVDKFYFELYINFEKILSEHGFESLEFIFWHELMHNFFRHFSRKKIVEASKKNHLLANILTDVVINEYLEKQLKIISTISNEGWNYNKLIKEFPDKDLFLLKQGKIVSVDELIDLFKDEFNNSEETQKMVGSLENNGLLDDHEKSQQAIKENGEEERKETKIVSSASLDNMIKDVLDSEIQKAKMQGKSPVVEEQIAFKIFKIKTVQLNKIKIINTIKKATKEQTKKTYAKIHRHKTFFTGISKKGKIPYGKKRKVVFGVDTSGSINQEELNFILSQIYNYTDSNNVSIDVIAWSCSITNFYQDVKKNEIKNLKLGSTGGTVVSFLYDFIEKQYKENITLINITDGYFSYDPLPKNISQHIIGLMFEDETSNVRSQIKSAYPKAKVIDFKIAF